MPSDPSSMRSGLGPAPEPGRRRVSISPVGVTARDRLDQVVDVRVQGREVAAGACRDPPAERRELERLREVAQREPVLAQLVLEVRARRAGLDQRRARDVRSTSSTRSSRARSSVTAAGVAVAHARLDAADDARAAAVRDHRRAALAAPFEHLGDLGLVRGGTRPRRAHGRSGRGRRGRCRGRPCRRRAMRVSCGSVVQMSASGPGGVSRGAGSSTSIERNRLLDLSVTEAEMRTDAVRSGPQLLLRGLLVLVPPPPDGYALRTADLRTARLPVHAAHQVRERDALARTTSASFFFSPLAAELSGKSLNAGVEDHVDRLRRERVEHLAEGAEPGRDLLRLRGSWPA